MVQLCVLGSIEVVTGGSPLPLGGPKERTLLAVLAVNANSVVPSARLIDALWGDDPPRTAMQTLQNYVLRLRKTFRQPGLRDQNAMTGLRDQNAMTGLRDPNAMTGLRDPNAMTGGGAGLSGDGAEPSILIERQPPGYRLVVTADAIDADRVARLGTEATAAFEGGAFGEAAALLAEALATWCGPSLAEFADQPFALAEAARLDGLREAMLEDQVEVALALGRHHESIAGIEALVADRPLRERRWGQLMVALYRSGRQADALRAYQSAREALIERLGLEPGPALRQLEQAVIDQDPALDLPAPGQAPVAHGPSGPTSSPAPRQAPPALQPELRRPERGVFVGRRPETERMRAAWSEACAGDRRLVLVGGEPGIGKTTTAQELAAWALESGATVLYGRNDEDLDAPYQPFAEALRWYLGQERRAAGEGPDILERAGPLAAGLENLLPELAGLRGLNAVAGLRGLNAVAGLRRLNAVAGLRGLNAVAGLRGTNAVAGGLPPAPEPLRSDPETERQRLFDAVAAVVSAIAEDAPVLLVLDDLHWAAKATLLMLRHLLRANAADRLMIVGTYRDTELGRDHVLPGVLAELNREQGVERMFLSGLDENEAVELIARRAGHDLDEQALAFARALHTETGGNPFFLAEILIHLLETEQIFRRDGRWTLTPGLAGMDLPTGVRELIEKRLARLGEPATRAVAVGAVVGAAFRLDLLERIPDAADDPDGLLDALDQAVGADVLTETPGRPGEYTFAHALFRQVVLSTLTAARRARLHRRVGETLESLPDADAHAGALARHFTAAGAVEKATTYALAAGRYAIDQLAFEGAAEYLETGVATLDGSGHADSARHADLLLALADARALAGDRAGAIAAADAAAADARALASKSRLAQAAMVRASLGVAGRPDAAVGPLCEEALAALDPEPSALRAKVMARLAMHRALWEGRRVEAEGIADQALALARVVGDADALHLALYVRTVTLVGSEHVELRLGLAEELVAAAEAAGDQVMRASGFRLRALARLEGGDVDGFRDDVARVEDLGTTFRRHQHLSEAARWRTLLAIFEGRYADAEDHAAEMLREAGDDMNARSAQVCQLFVSGRDQGRLELSRSVARAASEQVPGLVALRAMTALADAELGNVEQARAAFDGLAADRFAAISRDFTWGASMSVLAYLAHVLGDAERASWLLEVFRPHSGHLVVMGWGDACAGAVDRHLAILAATCGRRDEAERYFEGALALERKAGSPPSVARTQLAYGAMLAERGGPGDTDRARAMLDAAGQTARAFGMPLVSAQAAALLASLS